MICTQRHSRTFKHLQLSIERSLALYSLSQFISQAAYIVFVLHACFRAKKCWRVIYGAYHWLQQPV